MVSASRSPRVYERSRDPISGAYPLRPPPLTETGVSIEPCSACWSVVFWRDVPMHVRASLGDTGNAYSDLVADVSASY